MKNSLLAIWIDQESQCNFNKNFNYILFGLSLNYNYVHVILIEPLITITILIDPIHVGLLSSTMQIHNIIITVTTPFSISFFPSLSICYIKIGKDYVHREKNLQKYVPF